MEKNNTLNMNKKENIWDVTYFIIYVATLVHEFYFSTMFPQELLDNTARYFYITILMYVVLKLIYSKRYSRVEQIMSVALIAIFSISGVVSGYLEIVQYILLIIGAKGVDLRKILMLYSGIAAMMLIVAFVASQCGIIENLVYEDARRGKRYSFGCIYPTDFAAHVFYLIAALIASFNQKIKIWWSIIIFGIALLIYKLCYAYTSVLTLILLGVGIIIYCIKDDWKIKKGMAAIPILTALLFPALMTIYDGNQNFWYKLDLKLSYRMLYTSWGIRDYGFSLFGQHVTEYGNGLTTTYNENYFFIDDSYMRILIEYGIIVFIAVLIIILLMSLRMIKKNQIIWFMLLELVCLHSFMEHHLLELAYNPFIIYLYAKSED